MGDFENVLKKFKGITLKEKNIWLKNMKSF